MHGQRRSVTGRARALAACAAFVAVAAATGATGLARTGPPATTEATAAAGDLWTVGDGSGPRVLFDPVSGRRFPLPPSGGERAPAPSAEESAETGGSQVVDGWDVRLAGHRRSRFYPRVQPTSGPGTITQFAGGMCDGRPGPQVAVDPATVKVDAAGRVFWIDLNDAMHYKGLPYVRTLGLDGRVRTLGNIGGPLAGRSFRDYATSSGMPRLIPDGQGGVYYSFLGYFSISWDSWPTEAADDLPRTTVIGHLFADGHSEFVAGGPLSEGQNNGYGSDGFSDGHDGGPYAEAAFRYIDSMTADADGNLYVVDGNVPSFATASVGGSATRRNREEGDPQGHNDSRPVTVRFLNRSARAVTFYAGTSQELTVPAGQVQTIVGTRAPDAVTVLPEENRGIEARTAKLTFASGIDVGPDGTIRLLQVGDQRVQVLAVNTSGEARTVNGTAVEPGRVAVVAGAAAGYGGDGKRAVEALFDVRDANHWYYGDIALGPDGSVVVADTMNHRIRRVDPLGVVTTLAGTGSPRFDGDGRPGAATSLWYPMGADVRADGAVVFSDWKNSRVRLLDVDGRVRTLAGTGSPSLCGDGGPATGSGLLGGAGLGQPHDSVTDSRGTTYVSDLALGVIRRIMPDGRIDTVVGTPFRCPAAPPDVGGLPNCPPGEAAGDGGRPEQATLQAPGYLLLDRYDNLYISDGGQVRYVNFQDYAVTAQGMRIAPHTIVTVLQARADLRAIEVDGPFGAPAFTYYNLIGLTGLALDDAGTLYVSDTLNNRVLAKNLCGDLTVIAGNGSAATRLSGANGDAGPAVAASITPLGLAWDGKRRLLFIATSSEGRVRVVNLGASPVTPPGGVELPTGFVDTVAGGAPCNGYLAESGLQVCSYGDGSTATSAALVAPVHVSVDPGGRLFVTDTGTNLVRVVEPDGRIGTLTGITPEYFGGDVTTAFWFLGGSCGDGGISYRACLSGITSAELTPSGDLLVTESLTGHVRRIADALHAPLRPLNLSPPAVGAGWGFTDPLRLKDQQGDNALDPEIEFDRLGRAFVIAPRQTHGGSSVACDLWRYDLNVDGRGHDDYTFLGNPDTPVALPVPDLVPPLTSLSSGASCSLAAGGPGGVPLPPGTADPLGYVSGAQISTVRNARAGVSRDGGQTFLSAPVGVVTGATTVQNPRIASLGGDEFGMAYCCLQLTNNPPSSTIAYATSKGGVAYTHVANIDAIVFPRDVTPQEEQFVGKPIVTADAIYVPYHLSTCISPDATVCNQAFPSDSRLYVAKSTDGGLSWRRSPPIFSLPCTRATADGSRSVGWVPGAWCQGSHGAPQVVADRAGALYAVWDDGHHVFLSRSADGEQWTEPVQVDRELTVGAYPTVVAGDAGRIDIAFLGSTTPAAGAKSRDAEYYVYLAQSLDAASAEPRFTQTVASRQRVHSGILCQSSTCFGNGNMVSEVGNFFRVAISPVDGRAVIAYVADAGVGTGTSAGVSVIRQCDGPGLLVGRAAVPCAAGTPPTAAPPPVRVACAPQGRDTTGDATYAGSAQPHLDLTELGIRRDREDVVVRMSVAKLSTGLPLGATGQSWTAFWRFGRLDYYVQAVTPSLGEGGSAVAYTFGLVTDDGRLSELGDATGRVEGDGFVVTVPAQRVGDPKRGMLLTGLRARTDVLTGSPPATAALLPTARTERVDAMATNTGYDPGLACASPAAPTGSASPSPLPVAPAGVPPVVAAAPPAAVPLVAPSLGSLPRLAVPVEVPVAPAPLVAAVALPRRWTMPLTGAARPPVAQPVAAPVTRSAPERAAAAVPVLGCDARPQPVPQLPPVPPVARVPEPVPPAPAVPAPAVAPVEPPLTPVGPAPAPAPAPQPQPGPAQQAQAQQQPGAQAQPGAQVGIAGVPQREGGEARAYAASRSDTGPSPVVLAWLWTAAAVAGAGGAARARRRPAPAYERCRW